MVHFQAFISIAPYCILAKTYMHLWFLQSVWFQTTQEVKNQKIPKSKTKKPHKIKNKKSLNILSNQKNLCPWKMEGKPTFQPSK